MRKPNALQKLLHLFFMLRPITAFFAPRVNRIDETLLTLTGGRFAATEILGWNILQLTTIGARSHQPRRVPLVGLFDEEKIALVASSFGREHNPGWYYNLKAHPECKVHFDGHCRAYIAYEAAGEQYEKYWRLALSVYRGYASYKQRAGQRHIPVMVLEPKES